MPVTHGCAAVSGLYSAVPTSTSPLPSAGLDKGIGNTMKLRELSSFG
jgi:hypothetical protein